jgi:putative (di)nucleoside polyphosphate hydrolase
MALTELARFLPRANPHNRYLRAGMRSHQRHEDPPDSVLTPPANPSSQP